MNLVILAAGRGTRLGIDYPKCLLKLNGKTLLENHLETIGSQCDNIVIVAGYKKEMIDDAIVQFNTWPEGEGYLPKTTVVVNPDFETKKNGSSLAAGLRYLKKQKLDDDTIFIDADIIYDVHTIRDLFDDHKNVVLCCPCEQNDQEAVQVRVNWEKKHISFIGKLKNLDPGTTREDRFYGEALGIVKLRKSYANALCELAESKDEEWEVLLNEFIPGKKFVAIYAANDFCSELDTKEDVVNIVNVLKARNRRVNHLCMGIDGLDYEYINANIDALPTIKKQMELGSHGSISFTIYSSLGWSQMLSGISADPSTKARGAFEDLKAGKKVMKTGWIAIPQGEFIWNKVKEHGQKSTIVDTYIAKNLPPGFIWDNTCNVVSSRTNSFTMSVADRLETNVKCPTPSFGFGVVPSWKPEPITDITYQWWKDQTTDDIDAGLDIYEAFDVLGLFQKFYDSRIEMLKKIMMIRGSSDFLFWFNGEVDILGHLLYFSPKKYLIGHQIFDDYIRQVIEITNPRNFSMISDHGMTSIDNVFGKVNWDNVFMGKKFPFVESLVKQSKKYNCKIYKGICNYMLISGDHQPPNCMIFNGENVKQKRVLPNIKDDYYKIYGTLLGLSGVPHNNRFDIF